MSFESKSYINVAQVGERQDLMGLIDCNFCLTKMGWYYSLIKDVYKAQIVYIVFNLALIAKQGIVGVMALVIGVDLF